MVGLPPLHATLREHHDAIVSLFHAGSAVRSVRSLSSAPDSEFVVDVPRSPVLSPFWQDHPELFGFCLSVSNTFSRNVKSVPTFPVAMVGEDLGGPGYYVVKRDGFGKWKQDSWDLLLPVEPHETLAVVQGLAQGHLYFKLV